MADCDPEVWTIVKTVEISTALSKMKLTETEDLTLLVNCDISLIGGKFSYICSKLIESDYVSILNSGALDGVKSAIPNSSGKSPEEVIKCMIKWIDDSIEDNKSFLILQYVLLFYGISALQEFVRCNWTGPNQSKSNNFSLLDELSFTTSPKAILNTLSNCGISVYNNVKNPELLLFSKYLFKSIKDDTITTKNWWLLRCLMIHQQILLEKSGELYDEMKILIDIIYKEISHNDMVDLLLNIEYGLIHLYYHEINPAKKYFAEAQKVTTIEVELSGAFAKRTQFQTKAVAQLLIKLKRNLNFDVKHSIGKEFPKDIKLEDEVLLSKTEFIDADDNTVQTLLPEEQLIILSECCLVQKSDASDDLLNEKLLAYIDCLLSQPTVWSIQMKSLLMRSKLEKHKSRKIERAMKQIESLIGEIRTETPDLKTRQCMFYAALFPPYWTIEKELADLLLSLGAVKSALDIFLRLELWEEIVNCYKTLDQNEKAAAIVQQKLADNETPLLWCILGDVTNDIECYHKAWELSDHRSARSQSSIGYFYYSKKDYENCVSYFEQSLQLNHLQPNVWFSLAFAATQIQNFELASQSYRHVVGIDPDNFQAWNNLSNAYIRLKQKDRAYCTLQEALKCNFDNWRIWENYILVCMDVGAFEDAIHAYHRLIDLKGKYEDIEVLTILTRTVCNDIKDFNGHSSSRLKPKVAELFGRLTSIVPNNGEIWKQYSLLYLIDKDAISNKDLMERVVTFQMKGHKFSIQKTNWEKDILTCKAIILNAIELGENYCHYLLLLEGAVKNQVKSSAKLMLRNVLVRVEKQLRDYHDADIAEIEQHLETLKIILTNVESI